MNQRSDRLTTGIPGLDRALGGGLLPGAMVFLVGAPGSGKTITAQQMAFHAARGGGTALYFTALSEPHNKLISHVKGFAFFDEQLMGTRLQLLNLEQALRQGAEETADAIVQMARAERASLVLLDGFRGVVDFVGSPIRVREFLYQLGAKLAILGATSILTFEAEPRDVALHPEMTAADVVIGMSYRPYRVAHRRQIEVIKARGSAIMPGVHSMAITEQGVACYPQAEMLPIKAPTGISGARASFDLPALDTMLHGGLTAGTSTVLAGSVGAGKTLLALAWLLVGAARGEPGLLMGFQESATQLVDKAQLVGLDLRSAVDAGRIALWTQPPVALDPNRLAAGLRERIATGGVRRLVVDAEIDLEQALEPERVADYFAALTAYLNGEQVTTLFVKEIVDGSDGRVDFSDTPLTVLAENLIVLEGNGGGGPRRHAITVLKMRFSGFDTAPHAFAVAAEGISVGAAAVETAGPQHDAARGPASRT
jgi:circadian clock protein KaiC